MTVSTTEEADPDTEATTTVVRGAGNTSATAADTEPGDLATNNEAGIVDEAEVVDDRVTDADVAEEKVKATSAEPTIIDAAPDVPDASDGRDEKESFSVGSSSWSSP